MPINAKDIKKLWGLAAGRCSKPGCEQQCILFLDAADPTVVGEMAHIIAQSPEGPRGEDSAGEDVYENLILLCPTHHREIDKAPAGFFTAEVLQEWKRKHEQRVTDSLAASNFPSPKELFRFIGRLLAENRQIWMTYGPESVTAKSNPIANVVEVWDLRKMDTLVPNNRRITAALKHSRDLLSSAEYEVACMFVEHAEGFERNCFVRTEGVPRFPPEFKELVDRYDRQE
jgi:hypothetical protein